MKKNLGNIFMITLNGSEGADALVKKGMHLQQLCSDDDMCLQNLVLKGGSRAGKKCC